VATTAAEFAALTLLVGASLIHYHLVTLAERPFIPWKRDRSGSVALPEETSDHDFYLRRTFAVALRSRANGNHPFGAILVGPDGSILMEGENTCVTAGDRTGHAERNLLSRASSAYDVEFLSRCTLYSSAEPCAMCAGAAYWVGVGRVVYALSEQTLAAITGSDPKNLTMALGCRRVFATGQRPVEVIGPRLEDEAATVHDGFWSG
jgi:tRNA(Arg) A34 adenosine deaminase TadA